MVNYVGVSVACLLVFLSSGRASADRCVAQSREYRQSFVGVARTDPDQPGKVYQKWLFRIPIGLDSYLKLPGSPIFDGDSIANNDANDLRDIVPGKNQTEYARLQWGMPVNWSVGGDKVENLLYRLYALEQQIDFSKTVAPMTLSYNGVNYLRSVAAPFMVIHVGSNQVNTTESVANVAADIEAFTCVLRHELPLIKKIAVVSIYPRGAFFSNNYDRLTAINQLLATAAAQHNFPFIFVDANPYLEHICRGKFMPNGQCTLFNDLVHPLGPTNYQIDKMVAKSLRADPAS